jgi:hypothetical protein
VRELLRNRAFLLAAVTVFGLSVFIVRDLTRTPEEVRPLFEGVGIAAASQFVEALPVQNETLEDGTLFSRSRATAPAYPDIVVDVGYVAPNEGESVPALSNRLFAGLDATPVCSLRTNVLATGFDVDLTAVRLDGALPGVYFFSARISNDTIGDDGLPTRNDERLEALGTFITDLRIGEENARPYQCSADRFINELTPIVRAKSVLVSGVIVDS